ncbi:hypothetical protein Patl1_04121 [Pistacia atlantica]|uniref:Uncharacterized protein n=1 Tax=Pistacia atlantica TaxID=434234 RepID=A0ACC1BT94_9ROSI|nr:hypothetical protein Patl1_04121 [Pistacia atlantica]
MEFISAKFYILFLLYLFLFQSFSLIQAQQPYVNNYQLDCYDESTVNLTRGFVCNGVESSCQSYLTFRSNPPYNSPLSIAYLLASKHALITALNGLPSDIATVPTNTMVVVPVNCSCSSLQLYQHNAAYTILDDAENYYTIANETYQGLTTCRGMMEANSIDSRNLSVRDNLTVPLRCACPTRKQVASGVKFLLNYLVTWGDSISQIAELFNATNRSVLDANMLKEEDLIYPFTPILVPLITEPTKIDQAVPSPPPVRPPQTPVNLVVHSTSSSKKWVFVGVGTGACLLLLLTLLTSLFCFYKKSKSKSKLVSISEPIKSDDSLVESQRFRNAVESLNIYKFEDLQFATSNFSEENKIKESVYKGSFKSDDAAIKVMKGDVSSEINILKKINHSNIIRLSGFCVHEGNTYLVYEYAQNGSLRDYLHSTKYQTSITLEWKQRVQIAHDMANALNYLHKYTNPPYIHKNLNTRENVREKLRGFIDPCLRNEYPLELAFSMAQLANQCVAQDLNSRPSMAEVFMTLSKVLSSLSDWDPSDEIDRSKSLSRSSQMG